ncbi:MAG TPA: hypothetical protein H9815_07415 [Candidatus Ruania gallistercoris]|uniref:Peptidase inhibitor family I36 n=1 Tax=Candidatus Ruania gallistercoris TaxID=2838746 RepID=A0A9D2EEA8_9MICO|nr:hypothetical protein [Candidatus Ruania gallistercoris]
MSVQRFRNATMGLLATMGLTMTAFVGLSGAAEAAPDRPPDDGDRHGCPAGAVCIYPGDGWNGGNPSHVFWSYGVHRIYNQYGDHLIYNNQTDDAVVDICYGADGTDCAYIPADYALTFNLTPINSVSLRPS